MNLFFDYIFLPLENSIACTVPASKIHKSPLDNLRVSFPDDITVSSCKTYLINKEFLLFE